MKFLKDIRKNIALLLIVPFSVFLTGCNLDIPKEIVDEMETLPEKIDFNYHVKPILSDRCYACHGPDAKTRKAGLRLDIEEIAFSKLESNNQAFSKGDLYGSQSIHRIISDDPEIQMPPPESNLKLSHREKAIIIKWIEQGAEWKEHWAFLPPEKKSCFS